MKSSLFKTSTLYPSSLSWHFLNYSSSIRPSPNRWKVRIPCLIRKMKAQQMYHPKCLKASNNRSKKIRHNSIRIWENFTTLLIGSGTTKMKAGHLSQPPSNCQVLLKISLSSIGRANLVTMHRWSPTLSIQLHIKTRRKRFHRCPKRNFLRITANIILLPRLRKRVHSKRISSHESSKLIQKVFLF